MTKQYKITIAFLALLLSAFFSASAANTAPKVVFIGDQITHDWAGAFAANPNWINKGSPDLARYGDGQSGGVLARFQSDVVSLHPNIVHILIGPADASVVYDSNLQIYVPIFAANLDAMVKEARAANIKVVLGMGTQNFEIGGTLQPINAVIAGYGAANGIPVINYGDVLCGCVGSALSGAAVIPGGIGTTNGFGGDPLLGPPGPYGGENLPTVAGYAVMTQMAEDAIATMSLTLKRGGLQNVQVLPFDTQQPQQVNVNGGVPGVAVQFTPYGLYSDGSTRAPRNSTFGGSTGTWTSSNPAVMYVDQRGRAWAVGKGTASISYISPTGVHFSPWTMNVVQPSGF
jgi:hypothetical protein